MKYIYVSYKSNHCTGFTTWPLLVTYWPFGLSAVSRGYTEDMGPGTSSTLPLKISRSWIRGMERTNLPDNFSTVLTTPSHPGNSHVITPSGHLKRGCWSSCTRTTEPSRKENSNLSYSPETHNSGQNWKFCVLCELVIWQITVTLDWIHWWLWNDAKSLKQHRRGALMFFKVIRQISRSHGTINRRFWPQLSVSGL